MFNSYPQLNAKKINNNEKIQINSQIEINSLRHIEGVTQQQQFHLKNKKQNQIQDSFEILKQRQIENLKKQQQKNLQQNLLNTKISEQIQRNSSISLQSYNEDSGDIDIFTPKQQNNFSSTHFKEDFLQDPSTTSTPRFSTQKQIQQQHQLNSCKMQTRMELFCILHKTDYCLIQSLAKNNSIYECSHANHPNAYLCQSALQQQIRNKDDKEEFKLLCNLCGVFSMKEINLGTRSMLIQKFLICKFCHIPITYKNYVEHCLQYCQKKLIPQDYKRAETLEYFSPIVNAIQENQEILATYTMDEIRDFLSQQKKKFKFKLAIPFIINESQNYSCLLPKNMDQLSIQVGNYVIIMIQIYEKEPKQQTHQSEKKSEQKRIQKELGHINKCNQQCEEFNQNQCYNQSTQSTHNQFPSNMDQHEDQLSYSKEGLKQQEQQSRIQMEVYNNFHIDSLNFENESIQEDFSFPPAELFHQKSK